MFMFANQSYSFYYIAHIVAILINYYKAEFAVPMFYQAFPIWPTALHNQFTSDYQ